MKLNTPISPRKALVWRITALFTFFITLGISAFAQTQVIWTNTSPADFSTTSAWQGGVVPNSATAVAVFTNSGTCNYTTGDNFSFDQLWMGVTAQNVGGGINSFTMSDGALTLTDSGSGNVFSIGGNSTGSAASSKVLNTNIFTMTGGTLIASCSSGNNLIGLASNSLATVNFNGGIVHFTTNNAGTGGGLFIGGTGIGVLNINGANVTIDCTNRVASTTGGACVIGQGVVLGKGSGTLNMISGTLNVTNTAFVSLHIGGDCSNAVLNMSGGTINAYGLTYGNGVSSASASGTIIMSGGTLNTENGIGQNGANLVRTLLLSGGTFGNLFNHNWTASVTVPVILTNSPGPGIVNFAPAAGALMAWTTNEPFVGPGGINVAGPGTLQLAATNNFTGNTTISGGTLTLTTFGSLASPNIIVGGGATFNVISLASGFTLNPGQTLANSSATAQLNGNFNTASGTVSLTYDGANPSFSINNGTLTLSPSTIFTVNNTGAPLTAGSYLIVSAGAGGLVAGTVPSTVSVTGSGLASNANAVTSLSIGVDGQLYLVVAYSAPAIVSQLPAAYTNSFTLFAGASPAFSLTANAQPDFYFWFTNGVLDAAATGTNVTLSNVKPGAISVSCIVSNVLGTITNTWQANVIADPAASYPSSVLASGPVGYWRLNEADDGLSDGNPGAIAHDFRGGNDGIYTNVNLGQLGYSAVSEPAETSAAFGSFAAPNSLVGQVQGVDFAAAGGANAEFSIEALAQGAGSGQATGAPIAAKGMYGLNDEFNLGVDSTKTHYRFYVRAANGTQYTVGSGSSKALDGGWHHVVGVCDEANGKLSLYVDGVLANSAAIPANFGIFGNAAPMTIGAGTDNSTNNYDLQFVGNINDVAVYNFALSSNQVAGHYSAAGLTVSFTQQPSTNFNLFAGGSASWSVAAAGQPPISFQWYSNNVIVAGAISTNYLLASAQPPGSVQTYFCVASNSLGTATSAVVNVSVLADPAAPYPAAVVAANPLGYWRLNEANIDNFNNGVSASDYWGGHNGIYTNTVLGQSGYTANNTPNSDPTETSALFGADAFQSCDAYGINGVNFSTPTNTASSFSVEAWVNGYTQTSDAGIVSKGYSGAEQFDLDTGSDSLASHGFRFFVRDATGTAHVASSAIAPNGSAWHHLVGVCDESNGVVTLYVDGLVAGTASIAPGSGILASSRQMIIGSRPSNASTNSDDLQFSGFVSDVAVYNYALSAGQVMTQYAAAGAPPSFVQTPSTNVILSGGSTLTIPSTALGTGPIGYQWFDVGGGTNIASGSTNGSVLDTTLTVANVPGAWNNDTLQLTVTNVYGTTNITVALTVITNVQILSDLPPQVSLVSGRSYTYTIGANGQLPLTYQWYNGSAQIPGQTNASFTLTTGSPGVSTYHVVVGNSYGSVPSSVSTLTVFPQLATVFATNILQFNPVGYWPMHEVEAPAPGDIETNYGTLGLLGTGYYPDWALNSGGLLREIPGPMAGNSDSDVAVNFTHSEITGTAVQFTNGLFVPHISPGATLNPPFTVECWFYPTNTSTGVDVWSQNGDEGLNAGAEGGAAGYVNGLRMVWVNSGFVLYGFDNLLNPYTLPNLNPERLVGANSAAVPANQWYHLVVTCDVATNISVFTNGVQENATTAAAGRYAPDAWTPLSIGCGYGNTRSIAGYISEFAVYPTNLAASDVASHYATGTSASPATSYFGVVTNDNPSIYLRMNAADYTAPAAGTWPALTNYGFAGANGAYSPGTMPGIVAGPANSSGQSFLGLSGPGVAQFSGVSSYADAGFAPAFNPVGAVPFSITAMFRGNPCDGRVQTIIGHSDNSWRIAMNTNGTLQCQLGVNLSSQVNSTGVYNDGTWHQVTAVYTPNSNSALTGTNALYVDGVLDALTTGVTTSGITPGSTSDVMIGTDPQYTNNPAGVGRQFAGQICEVALFTNALAASQVQALYNLVVPSTVSTSPTSVTVTVTGSQLTLSWPKDHTGWRLQAQTNGVAAGLTTGWFDVGNSTSTNQEVIPVNAANGCVFYRLVYP